MIGNFLAGLFIVLNAFILIVGILPMVLSLITFWRKQKPHREKVRRQIEHFHEATPEGELPFVTFQFPVYNEGEVAARLIRSAVGLDYPRDRFEIQVLDDSTDDTCGTIDECIRDLTENEGISIVAVRRDNREGFKAGALENARRLVTGEYLALFDADFIIPRDFLSRAIPQIHGQVGVACVQGRWGHLNRDENLLTRGASIFLDSHGAFVQTVRSLNGLCATFGGSAGLLRQKAIDEVGGWSARTLCEDRELSFRMWAKGKKTLYDYDLLCMAELPNDLDAFKSQQRRWIKGGVQTLLGGLSGLLRSAELSWGQKWDVFSHLASSFTLSAMVLWGIVLFLLLAHNLLLGSPVLSTTIWLGPWLIFAMASLYHFSCSAIQHDSWFALKNQPATFAVLAGTSAIACVAMGEALLGIESPFVRTPKSGSLDDRHRRSRYRAPREGWVALLELVLGGGALFISLTLLLRLSQVTLGLLMLCCSAGLLWFFFGSLFGEANRPRVR